MRIENQLVITGDTAAISQIHVHDIENILLVPIDKVDRTQPFKLTIYFKTEGTSPASLVHITRVLNNICHGISIFNRHLDIRVGVYYHIVTITYYLLCGNFGSHQVPPLKMETKTVFSGQTSFQKVGNPAQFFRLPETAFRENKLSRRVSFPATFLK